MTTRYFIKKISRSSPQWTQSSYINFSKFIKNPKLHFKHLLKLLTPYKVRVNNKNFFVKYKPFWEERVMTGKWEPDTFTIFDKFIDKNHSFIDIGAHIGATTLYGCQTAKLCHAIECDPLAFRELKRNVALNSNLKSKIKLYDYCITDKCENVRFGNKTIDGRGQSGSSLFYSNSNNSYVVKGVTLQKFFEINKINDCNFIKMDIEGGELIVLPNIKNLLEKNKPTLHISLHPQFFKNIEKDSKSIFKTLKIYKNIFDNKGKRLSLDELFSKFIQNKIGCDIVATDFK